ncbi:hypothetical protein NQ315_004523 [Exocentrus adspersus]|uniref:Ig-like domain-containing protein n=1 Tax=Exocentrus adspersus TaxID=1586481 RepID=A0AAV8V7L1_9CUCU|nr:hypothetical protein NQ315_004523 [Exocentrus adspersus]
MGKNVMEMRYGTAITGNTSRTIRECLLNFNLLLMKLILMLLWDEGLNYQVEKGIYDLLISNASYDRDNGRFECKVKAGGSGANLHVQKYTLTVLTAPLEPAIAPSSHVTVTEGKRQELTCSSIGGSPDPQVKWYRQEDAVKEVMDGILPKKSRKIYEAQYDTFVKWCCQRKLENVNEDVLLVFFAEKSKTLSSSTLWAHYSMLKTMLNVKRNIDDLRIPLEAALKNGGSRDQPTTATLSINPSKEDDDAVFHCEVWNRALPEGKKLISTVSLSVNYFPRVEVGPENPLRVERGSQATLQCTVDAKPKVTTVRWTRNGRFISSSHNHIIHKVSIQDAGKYTCSADNGLGKVGEKEMFLDVLYPPIVTLEAKTREAEEGDSVSIKCNVSSNPSPITVEWVKDGKPDFRQLGDKLDLREVTAEHSGTYICRAVNIISPSSVPIRRSEKIGNASIALLIRHKPGRARIMPDKPVATEGSAVTLTCTATPPGWPHPSIAGYGLDPTASNELGLGDIASVDLEVHQPPSFKYKLKPLETKRVGDPNFSVACSAKGKPRPMVKWLKDDEELTPDLNMYEVKTDYAEISNGAASVQSVLKFSGKARPNGNELLPSDRGVYTCTFENEVKSPNRRCILKSSVNEPIVLHQYNKVAYDISETAEVVCKVQAYPKPEFKWFFGNHISPSILHLKVIMLYTPPLTIVIFTLMGSRGDRGMGRTFDEPIAVNDDYNPRVRVKLCLQTHPEHCGEFVEAENLALAMEDQKSVYATQNGYGYHVANPDIQSRQNINNQDWANMGYLENSYSNSNNGGSVNSKTHFGK